MVVKDIQAAHAEASLGAVKVNFDGTMPDWDHPEHVVPIDMYVVVVDLIRQLGRSNRTGVEIKSNKGEGASVLQTVRTDKLALTESHVCLERKRRCGTRHSVCSCPATTYVRQTHEPIEIGNL